MKGFLIALFQKEWLKLWEQQRESMRYSRGDYRWDPRRPRTVEVRSGPEPALSLSMQLCLFPFPNLGLAIAYKESQTFLRLCQATLAYPVSAGTGTAAKSDKLNLVPRTHVKVERVKCTSQVVH